MRDRHKITLVILIPVTPGGEFVVDEGAEIILRLFGSVYSLLLTLTSHPRPQIK